MPVAQSRGYEQIVMAFYAHNIVAALPLTMLAIKLVVRFFTREKAKDLFRSILVLPLDLTYIAFGLILAAIARRLPGFLAHYQNDKEADFAGMVLCVGLFGSACLITWMDRGVRVLWQKFYAAWNLAGQIRASHKGQIPLSGETKHPEIQKLSTIVLWMILYWSLMIPLCFLQAVVGVESLGVILKRVQ